MKYQPRGYNHRPTSVVTIVAISYFAKSKINLSNALGKKKRWCRMFSFITRGLWSSRILQMTRILTNISMC